MSYGLWLYHAISPWDIGLLYFRQANIPAMHLSYDFARLVELGPPDTWRCIKAMLGPILHRQQMDNP